MKKSHLCTVQYVLRDPNILLLTSRGLRPACKVQELVLTLNLSQEQRNAMRLCEVRLQKGPCGCGFKQIYQFLSSYFLQHLARNSVSLRSSRSMSHAVAGSSSEFIKGNNRKKMAKYCTKMRIFREAKKRFLRVQTVGIFSSIDLFIPTTNLGRANITEHT